MNRDFFLPKLTPAKARMMVAASQCANIHLSREIITLAEEDRAEIPELSHDTQYANVAKSICQFIIDYEHRCVIPYDFGADIVRTAIAHMIPEDRSVIFVTDDPVLWVRKMSETITPFANDNSDRLQYLSVQDLKPSEMVRVRDRYMVANITPTHMGYEWLGRLFKQMVIYCSMEQQLGFRLFDWAPAPPSAAHHASAILYPAVVQSINHHQSIRAKGNATLPLMGCFNKLIRSKTETADKDGAKQIVIAGRTIVY